MPHELDNSLSEPIFSPQGSYRRDPYRRRIDVSPISSSRDLGATSAQLTPELDSSLGSTLDDQDRDSFTSLEYDLMSGRPDGVNNPFPPLDSNLPDLMPSFSPSQFSPVQAFDSLSASPRIGKDEDDQLWSQRQMYADLFSATAPQFPQSQGMPDEALLQSTSYPASPPRNGGSNHVNTGGFMTFTRSDGDIPDEKRPCGASADNVMPTRPARWSMPAGDQASLVNKSQAYPGGFLPGTLPTTGVENLLGGKYGSDLAYMSAFPKYDFGDLDVGNCDPYNSFSSDEALPGAYSPAGSQYPASNASMEQPALSSSMYPFDCFNWNGSSPYDSQPMTMASSVSSLDCLPLDGLPQIDKALSHRRTRSARDVNHKTSPVRNASISKKWKTQKIGPLDKPPVAPKTFPQPPNLTGGIQIVQEDGLGGAIAPSACMPPVARARRNGPLTLDGRRDAAMRRKDKSVCAWCRLAKKKCNGESPCSTCIEAAKSMVVMQPCVKADFFQIIESGTCNFVSQHAVNHLTLEGKSRVRMEVPSSFEIRALQSMLEQRLGRFDIRARQAWGPTLYVIDLAEMQSYLRDLARSDSGSSNGRCLLSDFINRRVAKGSNWVRCVRDCDPLNNFLALLSQWNNMPSRVTYDFVPVAGAGTNSAQTERQMDPQNSADRAEILLAAQLSRILCRKLEIDGFRMLQNCLNKNKWETVPQDDLYRFIDQLGRVLLTLRWRVSWWELFGDGSRFTPGIASALSEAEYHQRDHECEMYEDRAQRLCRVLYFYYMSVKVRLPAFSNSTHQGHAGVWSTYADALPVWDDFPTVSTMEGFEAWMARGKDLIREGKVERWIGRFER